MYKSFQKNDIIRHFNKKKSCGTGDKVIIETQNTIMCESCNSTFTNKHNLQRHIKNSCRIAALEKELINLKKSGNPKRNITNINHTTNINHGNTNINHGDTNINNTNNTNIHLNVKICINSYENTSLDKISDTDFSDIITNSEEIYYIIPRLIKNIHFNPKIPENHNIYISNMGKYSKYINLFRDGQWVIEDKQTEVDNIMHEKENNLTDWAEEKGRKYPKAAKKINEYKRQKYDEDNIKIMKDEIEKILYNNRNMVKSRRAQHNFNNE